MAEEQPERASGRLREALALWRGPPLAQLADEPFARIEIGRLEEERLDALEERVEADLAVGLHSDVIPELESLVARNPYRERLRAHLMLALYQGGRQADSLAAYQDARTALVENLGVEPGARLRELHADILAQDPALGPPAPTGRRSHMRSSPSPLAGADGSSRRRRQRLSGWPQSCSPFYPADTTRPSRARCRTTVTRWR